jgi:hypothetical protein
MRLAFGLVLLASQVASAQVAPPVPSEPQAPAVPRVPQLPRLPGTPQEPRPELRRRLDELAPGFRQRLPQAPHIVCGTTLIPGDPTTTDPQIAVPAPRDRAFTLRKVPPAVCGAPDDGAARRQGGTRGVQMPFRMRE